MKSLRLLLMLCLCVAVPFSATAALLDGPVCPEGGGAQAQLAHHHEHSSHHHADLAAAGAVDHCQQGDQGKSCPGSHCSCGCGFGLCGTVLHFQAVRLDFVALVPPQRLGLRERPGLHAEPPAGALLRPPIA